MVQTAIRRHHHALIVSHLSHLDQVAIFGLTQIAVVCIFRCRPLFAYDFSYSSITLSVQNTHPSHGLTAQPSTELNQKALDVLVSHTRLAFLRMCALNVMWIPCIGVHLCKHSAHDLKGASLFQSALVCWTAMYHVDVRSDGRRRVFDSTGSHPFQREEHLKVGTGLCEDIEDSQ